LVEGVWQKRATISLWYGGFAHYEDRLKHLNFIYLFIWIWCS